MCSVNSRQQQVNYSQNDHDGNNKQMLLSVNATEVVPIDECDGDSRAIFFRCTQKKKSGGRGSEDLGSGRRQSVLGTLGATAASVVYCLKSY